MTGTDTSWRETWAQRERVADHPDAPGLFLALAPMDGVTDAVYRGLLTEQFGGRSGISLCVSEFVRVTRDPVPAHVIRRHCPEVDTGGRTRAGVPVFVQLLGGDPTPMAATARRAAELGACGVDLNFGCPAKTVNSHDGGAKLLKEPDRIERITRAARDAVPHDVPVTVKIRIGWDSGDTIEEIARAAARGGATWLTVHARTRVQLYRPPVHWHVLARARDAAGALPVIANGDLFAPEDLARCAASSRCHAFMIGRGAMGSPGLFARARGWRQGPMPLPELAALLREYQARMRASGLPEARALCRVKQWLRMAAATRPDIVWLFNHIKVMRDWAPAAVALIAVERGALAAGEPDDALDRAG
ncbi:MAG: tRNA-dihydrouridine synthase family protein [Myxococcales bacterium]|nr:tRNA-dihydrouridine synthase family protein [Myxococcales bacterium]MCB9750535.1 tRNA-dihydrouridine synthase family protein [Myxococcales bacterium]